MDQKKISMNTILKCNDKEDWKQKIGEVLQKVGQPVSPRELVDLLFQYFPLKETVPNTHIFYASKIFLVYKCGRIKMYLTQNRSAFYCLPEWYNENGKLRQDFIKLCEETNQD